MDYPITYRRAYILFLLLSIQLLVCAQHDSIDNIHLKDFVFTEKREDAFFNQSRYSAGTRVQIADSAVLAQLQNSTLSDYLLHHTSVFIKESGNGMLSTISMRGTASSHTTVTWNGLTINPLTMGQVDFSQLPIFFFEKIAVHPGGESALYGNGAIGGAILLGSDMEFRNVCSSLFQESIGAYGYNFSGVKAQVGTKKWQIRTALMLNKSENDFDIKQETFSGTHTEKQQNASYSNYGILQDVAYKISAHDELTLNFWHTYYYREIQPSVQNNYDTASYDNITNRNTRILCSFKHQGYVNWLSHIAYMNDYQMNQNDIIASNNFFASVDADKAWKKIFLKAGLSTQYIVPEVYSYSSGIIEWRSGIYLLSRYRFFNFLEADLNLRQDFVSGINVPFTPSLGLVYEVLKQKNQNLKIRTNVSRSFKVPTLNDRYWGGLDNRYLSPEDGLNCELGTDYSVKVNKYSADLSVSSYYNKVNNWIMWMPRGDIWKPQNIDLVLAQGIEAELQQKLETKQWKLALSVNYAYTLTTVLEGFEEMAPFKNRQMPLLPKHTINSFFQVDYKKVYWNVNTCYVGERSTSNVFDVMPAYFVVNTGAGYNFIFVKNRLNLSIQYNNIFKEEYQTVPNKAMPLYNWCASLKWIFEK